MQQEITTIKLSRKTKERIEHLRSYKRESYEDILEKMLDVLNICRLEPGKAHARLIQIERERRDNLKLIKEKSLNEETEKDKEKLPDNRGKLALKINEKIHLLKGAKLNK